MNENILFSIVMPVYNAEKYLITTIESILAQTYKNFELIIVNDCCQNNIGRICDKYQYLDNRISITHKDKNEGISKARNKGISVAKGDYILFIDSDDVIDDKLLQLVYESLVVHTADVVVFGAIEEYYDNNDLITIEKRIQLKKQICKNRHDVRKIVIYLEEKALYGCLWNKAYNLKYIKQSNIQFQKYSMYEDLMFNIKFFNDISSMNVLSECPYHYFKRDKVSLTHSLINDYYELSCIKVNAILMQYSYWNMCDNKVKTIMANIYLSYLLSSLQRTFDKQNKYDSKARIDFINNITQSELFLSLKPFFSPNSRVLRLFASYLVNDNKYPCLLLAKSADLVKNLSPALFNKLASNR